MSMKAQAMGARQAGHHAFHGLHKAGVWLCAAMMVVVLAVPQSSWAQRKAVASREPVTVNFVNADIEAVSRAMGVILNKQFVVDPRVKGSITVYSETPITPREAYLNYLAALRGAGAAVVESGGLLKVVPEADAKTQTGTVSVGSVGRRGDQIITQIFRLQYENANNLVPVLRPLISPNNTINANPGNNTLVITDYADNLQRIAKIVASMDLPSSTDLEVVPVRHAVAADIAPMVQKMADAQSATGAAATGTGVTMVLADPRTNALLVRAPNPSKLAIVKQVVAKLDTPGQGGMSGSNIHVVYLKHAEAVKLAQILRAAYVVDRGTGAGGTSPLVTGGTNPAANQALAQQAGGANATGGLSAQATAPVSQSGGPQTGGFVQADPSTNSLIITAPEPMYRQLRAVIDQLDSRRAQVYVEALIVEVNADKAADIGVQWQSLLGQSGNNVIGVGGTNFGTGANNLLSLAGATTGGTTGVAELAASGIKNGFNLAVLGKVGGVYSIGALAQFLQTKADGNILSTPTLLTLDNEEAKIVVGQNVPFLTGQYATTGGQATVNPFQTVERKDVGLTLRIKPQIGENGTVRLTIFQESSSVVDTTNAAGLITKKRSIESQVVVDDGAMLAIGGLMEDSYSGSESKVPGLGDVPVVGGLFRSENRSRKKTNLMVFLRPVVVRSQDDANRVSLDRYDMIRAKQQQAQPQQRWLLPINEAPVIPPLPAETASVPARPVPSQRDPVSRVPPVNN